MSVSAAFLKQRLPSLAVVLPIFLLAWGVRVGVVGTHRLHPDEALHAYWGLHILTGYDPWLITVPVYKPPLLPYVLAGSMGVVGRTEWAVRFPGLVAGLVTVGLAARLARRLYRSPLAGQVAAVATALSPFGILFSATAFADPLMVVFGLAGCVMAIEDHPGWAGLLAGLSVAAKQTGVVWLPLVGALALAPRRGKEWSGWLRMAGGFLLIVGGVWGWDRGRVLQGAESFWRAGVEGYGGLRMIWPMEWGPRLRDWFTWLGRLLGTPWLNVLLAGGALVLVGKGMRQRTWPALFDAVLVGFFLAYLLVHWLWAFPVWDRYLLPLAPLAGVLLGRVVSVPVGWVAARMASARRWLAEGAVLLLVGVCLAAPAARAAAGEVAVGAGFSAYDGIEQVADFLWGLPEGTVLYDHWLGWEYAFYLYGSPLHLIYWPTPIWLAQDVQARGRTDPGYLVIPAWESSARVEAALREVGYALEPMREVRGEGEEIRFIVYRLAPFD